MFKEIKTKKEVLRENGDVFNPGFSYKYNFLYKRERINKRFSRVKEWDFYQFTKNDWLIQFTIGHASLFVNYSFLVLNIKTGERYGANHLLLKSKMNPNLEINPEIDHNVYYKNNKFEMSITLENNKRILYYKGKYKDNDLMTLKLIIDNDINNDKMCILTPFYESTKMFYLNFKENYYNASFEFKKNKKNIKLQGLKGVLDFGRGFLPYKQEWYWGNSTSSINNHDFSFNIGWGFGDTSLSSENIFFYDRKGYKLDKLIVKKKDDSIMSNVIIDDNNGIFHLEMEAIYDNYTHTDFLYIHNKCHQVFYKAKGYIIINNNKISFSDCLMFLEHAKNMW